ncbi:MAG: NAD(+)/NADH kinase [Deltaproteobacteria bacterium]|nr:NAD(+)/NADH kinase [Deltaproteobacteria bacterium]
MRKIGLVIKEDRKPKQVARSLKKWLRQHGVEVFTDISRPDLDAVIVLGGDGTLLRAARVLGNKKIPVLGVNLGGLGFLTEVSYDARLYAMLERFLAGDFTVGKRMMLQATVLSETSGRWTGSALNEIVISKGALSNMIKISVWEDDELITSYEGDGLIISTPTGSTAYNLSAGGPIVHPELKLIIMTPICPFMLSSRPIILPDSANIKVKVTAGSPDVHLILDGQVNYELGRGESITVNVGRARGLLHIVKSPARGYFSILRNKLKWGEQEI